jgi:hypothetical protein
MSKNWTREYDNRNVGEQIKCYCNKCEKEMNHVIMKSVGYEFKEVGVEYAINGSNDYQIIKCVGCDDISFRKYSFFSEFQDQDWDGTWEELFPEITLNKRKEIKLKTLPYNLKTIYDEAIICYNQKMYILCAIGIRAILEGICNDRKIVKGKVHYDTKDGSKSEKVSTKLDGKINGLNEAGIITKIQMEALHELRFLGNKAIHELDEPSCDDLDTAFDIIEHILNDIYDLPIKTKTLEAKRIK